MAIYYLPPIVKNNQTAGGSGGAPFDDRVDTAIPPVVGIKSITIHYGQFRWGTTELIIHSIQSTFFQLGGLSLVGNIHGFPNGTYEVPVKLGMDEKIVRIEGRISRETESQSDFFICQITFYTSGKENFKKHGPFGCSDRTPFMFNGTILGFYGRSGEVIDRLGIYVVPEESTSN